MFACMPSIPYTPTALKITALAVQLNVLLDTLDLVHVTHHTPMLIALPVKLYPFCERPSSDSCFPIHLRAHCYPCVLNKPRLPSPHRPIHAIPKYAHPSAQLQRRGNVPGQRLRRGCGRLQRGGDDVSRFKHLSTVHTCMYV